MRINSRMEWLPDQFYVDKLRLKLPAQGDIESFVNIKNLSAFKITPLCRLNNGPHPGQKKEAVSISRCGQYSSPPFPFFPRPLFPSGGGGSRDFLALT